MSAKNYVKSHVSFGFDQMQKVLLYLWLSFFSLSFLFTQHSCLQTAKFTICQNVKFISILHNSTNYTGLSMNTINVVLPILFQIHWVDYQLRTQSHVERLLPYINLSKPPSRTASTSVMSDFAVSNVAVSVALNEHE